MDKITESAKRHIELTERFGRQARQELTPDEVTEIARRFLECQDSIQTLQAEVAELQEQNKGLRAQRDSANGKLSALRRKYGNE